MFFDITTPARRIFQKNGGFLLAGVVCFIYFCSGNNYVELTVIHKRNLKQIPIFIT